jgi:hypothetical protein
MSYKDNNEVRQMKRQAKNLREYFASKGVDIPNTLALEAVSRLQGDKSWNVTSAKAKLAGQIEPLAGGITTRPASREWKRVTGQLSVELELDLSYAGQFVVAVRHPSIGYLQCQTPVWWQADLVLDDWKAGMLEMVLKAVKPLVDETLVATEAEREEAVFEVLHFCCMTPDGYSPAQNYVDSVVAEWKTRGLADLPLCDWNVAVCRVGYGHANLSVRARTEKEAEELATDQAGDIHFSEHDAEYEVTGILRVR